MNTISEELLAVRNASDDDEAVDWRAAQYEESSVDWSIGSSVSITSTSSSDSYYSSDDEESPPVVERIIVERTDIEPRLLREYPQPQFNYNVDVPQEQVAEEDASADDDDDMQEEEDDDMQEEEEKEEEEGSEAQAVHPILAAELKVFQAWGQFV